MPYVSSPVTPGVHETPFRYSSSRENFAYEVSLRTASSSPWLGELRAAHRLVQVLLRGELLGQYELLDFLIWPEGLLTRVSLRGSFSLSEFLSLLKEKSAPAGGAPGRFWDDELQWIKLVPPEKIPESTGAFLQTAGRIRQGLPTAGGAASPLFFFYRNSRLL
ncbi:MAG TPA: hypothetical protein VK859_05460 [bacterium]|nr:hypothetical protein [bacterium]